MNHFGDLSLEEFAQATRGGAAAPALLLRLCVSKTHLTCAVAANAHANADLLLLLLLLLPNADAPAGQQYRPRQACGRATAQVLRTTGLAERRRRRPVLGSTCRSA